ncbi:MAG: OPT family oligopeptide transporter, partial [Pirellulales bacterium]
MTIESAASESRGAPPVDEYEQDAREWLANVYQGDSVRQLSVRSIVTGMLIGGVMSVSNLYVGLKTGWGLDVMITASIIAFAVYRSLEVVSARIRRDPFTILENYTMSSASTAAAYMASAGLVSAIPALYLATGLQLSAVQIMTWLASLSVLGVFMAIPLKRQMINIDKLPFPSGMAAAETLKSIHTTGQEALAKAYALFAGAVVGAGVKLCVELGLARDTLPLMPGERGRRWLDTTSFGFEGSLIMVGVGALMGIRVGGSLLLGAVIYFGTIGPVLVERGIVDPVGYGRTGVNTWTLWPATALMVAASLTSFAVRWRTVLRAFGSMASIVQGRAADDPLKRIEVPGWWFVVGTLVSGTSCVVLGEIYFGIAWWMGVIAVLFTFMLSIVAARATGETNITPIGAMGKITQLLYGWLAPTNLTTNLMTASITSGAAAHSADLLMDLKCGYLLGGNPRKQTISQLFGVLAGTLVCVPAYMLVVSDPEKLGTEELPAPAAQVWAGVAELLAKGLDNLPRGAVPAMAVGALAGVLLALAEEFAPPRVKKWIPSS